MSHTNVLQNSTHNLSFMLWRDNEQKSDSFQFCEYHNGGLAVIIDERNQKAIELFLDTADPGGDVAFWIGLTDLFEEGNFVWSNGDKSTYRNWLAGEPNNYGGHEDFVNIMTKGNLRTWNDCANACPYPAMALCQFDLWLSFLVFILKSFFYADD